MKIIVQLSVLLLVSYTIGSKISIQIESEDVLKLLNGLMSSDVFRDVAVQMVQRADFKKGIYNNPYHPEDDNVNDDFEININNKPKKDNKQKTLNDVKLERDNENYILGGESKSEDELDSDDKTDNNITQIINQKDTLIENNNDQIKNEKDDTRKSDMYNFKKVQKRFMLKRS